MQMVPCELYAIPKDNYHRGDTVKESKRGAGGSAVFVARNRFAVLEKSSNQVLVKNLKSEIVKKSVLSIATDAIFYAGNLLYGEEDRAVIFDLQQSNVLGDLQTPFVRYVVWSLDMASVALLSKHSVVSIVIADKNLVHRCTLHETIRVKSGSWDDNGVFIYTTLTHAKYCLPNVDIGIIKTMDVPVYVTKIYGNSIFCLDREGNGFNLALECGNIEKALESAKKIDEKDHWYRLGVEPLGLGNAGIVEYAYQKTKSFERLSFHYLITGNLEKLSKMMRSAEVKNDVMGQFHDALYLGDIRERVKFLENAGHLPLAYVTATVHGLDDFAERVAVELGDNIPHLPKARKPAGDWPSLMVSKGIFEGDLGDTARGGNHDYEDAADADWGEGLDIDEVDKIQNVETLVCWRMRIEHEENEEGGWDLEDLDLPPDADTPKTTSNSRSSEFVGPSPGMLLLNILLLGISTQQCA